MTIDNRYLSMVIVTIHGLILQRNRVAISLPFNDLFTMISVRYCFSKLSI